MGSSFGVNLVNSLLNTRFKIEDEMFTLAINLSFLNTKSKKPEVYFKVFLLTAR